MKIYLRKVILFILPLLLILTIILLPFFVFDPFKILKSYSVFYDSEIAYNEDYVATERFLRSNDDYNSFIFGSSRAGCAFPPHVVEKYLQNTDKVFSYAASSESIFGIHGKILLVNQECKTVDNVIIVIDPDITFNNYVNSNGHLFIKHPKVSNQSRKSFVSEYIKDFIFTGFFIRYYDYLIFHQERSYMGGYFDFKNLNTQSIYAPFDLSHLENLIQNDKEEYYLQKDNVFNSRDSTLRYHNPKITDKGVEYLMDIKRVFDKRKTKYKIVISPLFEQVKINKVDYNILSKIFGLNNVYDFSGVNILTSDITSYYEKSHYRIHVGEEMLRKMYH